jgi:hypothetical protein
VDDQDIPLTTLDDKEGTRVFSCKGKTFQQEGMVTKKLAMPPTIHGSKFKEAMLKEKRTKSEKRFSRLMQRSLYRHCAGSKKATQIESSEKDCF